MRVYTMQWCYFCSIRFICLYVALKSNGSSMMPCVRRLAARTLDTWTPCSSMFQSVCDYVSGLIGQYHLKYCNKTPVMSDEIAQYHIVSYSFTKYQIVSYSSIQQHVIYTQFRTQIYIYVYIYINKKYKCQTSYQIGCLCLRFIATTVSSLVQCKHLKGVAGDLERCKQGLYMALPRWLVSCRVVLCRNYLPAADLIPKT